MISLIDIARLMKSNFVGKAIFPLEFPVDSPNNAFVVEMSSNSPVRANVFELLVQVKVRDVHPTLAEAQSYEVRSFLENKTNFKLGNTQVILVQSQNPVPLYVGKDSTGNHFYMNNFRFIINEGAIS